VIEPEIIERALEELDKNTQIGTVVLYHGGEPFLHRDFLDLLRETKQRGVRTKTVTNGMVWRNDLYEGLVDLGLDEIMFSLDGLNGRQSDAVRVGSSHLKILGNMKRLIDVRIARNSDTPEIKLSNVQFFNPATPAEDPIPQFPHWIEDGMGDHARFVKEYDTQWAMKWPGMHTDGLIFDVVPHGKKKRACSNIFDTIAVRWNGDVVACCQDLVTFYPLGNVKKSSLQEIFNGSPRETLLNAMLDGNPISGCKECPALGTSGFLVARDPEFYDAEDVAPPPPGFKVEAGDGYDKYIRL